MRANNTITSFDQLSLTLNATQVAAVLGISRSNAYALMRSEGFPTLHIGKRMLVPKPTAETISGGRRYRDQRIHNPVSLLWKARADQCGQYLALLQL